MIVFICGNIRPSFASFAEQIGEGYTGLVTREPLQVWEIIK